MTSLGGGARLGTSSPVSFFPADNASSDEAVSPVYPGVWAVAVGVGVPLSQSELCQGRSDDQESVRGVQGIPVSDSGQTGFD